MANFTKAGNIYLMFNIYLALGSITGSQVLRIVLANEWIPG